MSPSARARDPRPAAPRLLAGLVALAVTGLGVPGLGVPLATTAAAEPVPITDPVVDLVDADATAETRSLFAYLRDVRGQGMLFGHQHTTDVGETFTTRDGVSSDVLAATGDHPAVFGFDTLSIEGNIPPGVYGGPREENALLLAQGIREAHDLGGISTLSMHMENPVTGGDFYDTSGDTLRAVLPGGTHNAELRAYLDLVALAADNARDADGNRIPIVFRPWHENTGSWFWWGAAFGTPGEFKELFRFTVEYLRDVKGVDNLLYSWSPNGTFGGDAQTYLRTYPGDDFVDVLGYDYYDDSGASPARLATVVADLGMIADLADARGKVSTFTETGPTGGIKPDGENLNTSWFTDLLAAIEADPRASRNAWMLTWANFGGSNAPWTPTEGEMLPDFQAFHADPYTYFADEVEGAFDAVTEPVAAAPVAHLASPSDGSRVASGPTTLRATISGVDVERASVTVGGAVGEVVLTPPAAGELWWTGEWAIPADELGNSTRALTLRVVTAEGEVTVPSAVVLGPEPVFPPGVMDDFEGYGDDTALRAEYVQYNANTITLERAATGGSVGSGDNAMRLAYDFANQSYTGVGRQVGADWSGNWDFSLWVDPDASGNKLVLQLVAGGVSYEAYPSLAGDAPYVATIPFADWRPAPWDTGNADRRITQEDLENVTQFNVYVNAADGGASSGAIVVDDLKAVLGTPPPPVFRDTPRTMAEYEAIEWLAEEGLAEAVRWGDSGGRSYPTRAVKAGELAALLRAYDPEGDVATPAAPRAGATKLAVAEAFWRLYGSPATDVTTVYSDVPAASAEAVAWAVETEVVPASSSTSFGVGHTVKRSALAAALFRFDALPSPLQPVVIADFEAGDQGWAVPSWSNGTATASDGILTVEAGTDGAWLSGPGGIDLTGRTELRLDVAGTSGFDTKVALQLGPDWTWCETGQAGWVQEPGEVVVDLTTLTAECQALVGTVQGVNVFLNGGTHRLDAISVH